MKKNNKRRSSETLVKADERGLEIVKAVAQAWYSHSEASRLTTNEFDARKRNFRGNPTRFKLEAIMRAKKNKPYYGSSSNTTTNSNNYGSASWSTNWDFGRSLWDSYEIVTVSKRLESGLVLDSDFSEISYDNINNGISDNGGFEIDRVHRKRRESKNSLRSLFTQMTSKRFGVGKIPRDYDL